MKKQSFVVLCVLFALVSCKKNYTCECTSSSSFPNYPVTTYNTSTGKMKKAAAEKKCDEGDKSETKSVGLNTYEYTTDCAIK